MKNALPVAALAVLVSACSGGADSLPSAPAGPTLAVWTISSHETLDLPRWACEPEMTARTEAAASVIAQQWGADPAALNGWGVRFSRNVALNCGAAPACADTAGIGCVNTETREIDVTFTYGDDPACAAATMLAHEIGHVLIGDLDHADPRWSDASFWQTMAAALSASTTDAACQASIVAMLR